MASLVVDIYLVMAVKLGLKLKNSENILFSECYRELLSLHLLIFDSSFISPSQNCELNSQSDNKQASEMGITKGEGENKGPLLTLPLHFLLHFHPTFLII
ncbi:unnamed protein product [Ilex paraguariensis]|uniref:Uncharacterized protein n=1 Tax=Ilex paraguariensis TaxID=185542 RepID=A0ABC8TS68_9AQUA